MSIMGYLYNMGGINMKSILVATDGSETSKKAIIEARELAESMGSKVTIIHVASNVMIPIHADSNDLPTWYEEARVENEKRSLLLINEALKIFQDFPREVSTLNKVGDAGEEILKEAEKEDYDLIIMGSRGQGAFSRAILGSVSNKVLNHVSKNVLIIK